jgi:hypothetical protein
MEETRMKIKLLLFACASLVAVAFMTPAVSRAQSPFDGTWRVNIAQAKFSPKPIVFYLSQGWYHCVSCSPAFDAKADGADQAVTGQTYDTISVKEVDPKTIELVAKKNGKVMTEQTRTVSANGKELSVKITSHPMNSDQAVTEEATAKLVGVAPSGVNATSGNWQLEKIKESDNGVTVTYKTTGDQLTMSEPTGETYTAKLDGTDAPITGSYSYDTVSIRKVSPKTLEETLKRSGTVVEVNKMTVSGRTMTIVSDNKLTDRTETLTATKM